MNDRLQELKEKISEIKKLHAADEWIQGDDILFGLLKDGHLDWLIEQAEKAKRYEKALKEIAECEKTISRKIVLPNRLLSIFEKAKQALEQSK